VIAVIIESGVLYTTSIAGFAITFLLRSNGQHPALSLITPLVVSICIYSTNIRSMGKLIMCEQGFVFCLIVLQIHLQLRLFKPSATSRSSRLIQLGWRESGGVDVGECATHVIAFHISE
jgi:hypothetical protein